MVVFNPSKREIGAKIVYYGPAQCGKTTNLQYVHKKLNPKQRGDLVSLATKDDRTLFFDFLPLDLGSIRGFKTRFHLYTVPGQVYYVSTRRAVLTGVDGVVFVADSQEEKMAENIESLEDLEKNLSYYGKRIEDIPIVLQYNKRDVENTCSVEELNEKLNKRNLASTEASAITGKGVMETLTLISKAVLESLEDGSRKAGAGRRPSSEVKDVVPPIPKPSIPPPPPRPREERDVALIELGGGDEEISEVERLKADRRASIDRLLTKEQGPASGGGEMPQTPEDLGEIPGELGDGGTLEIEGSRALREEFEAADQEEFGGPSAPDEGMEPLAGNEFEEELETGLPEASLQDTEREESLEHEPEAPLEVEEIEAELEPEFESSLELEAPEEEIELAAEEDLILEEPEEIEEEVIEEREHVDREGEGALPAEAFAETGETMPEDSDIEIIRCESPQIVSKSSVRLPLTVKLKEIEKEAKITVTVRLDAAFLKK